MNSSTCVRSFEYFFFEKDNKLVAQEEKERPLQPIKDGLFRGLTKVFVLGLGRGLRRVCVARGGLSRWGHSLVGVDEFGMDGVVGWIAGRGSGRWLVEHGMSSSRQEVFGAERLVADEGLWMSIA